MTKALAPLLLQLHREHPVKTWSLIITFLGDSIVPRGGSVSSATVQTLMEELGVGAGAVRTAFSRLAKDNWVERERRGRNSFYSLSATGYSPFFTAAERIYAKPPGPGNKKPEPLSDGTGSDWLLATCNPLADSRNTWKDLVQDYGGIKLTNNTGLFRQDTPGLSARLIEVEAVIVGHTLHNTPEWLKQLVGPQKVAARYLTLQKQFSNVGEEITADPLTALAARCLLIHEWRRLLLRNNDLHDQLLPANWPRDDCHRFVAGLYHQLSPSAERWLDEFATGPNGKLTSGDPTVKNRFGK
ncbi:hypothetical protein AB833_24095 [Chromatiales bacterium (ex Bugula neritina AB1)]|nr:hypothetical protein AB833_24095 [Chromatiales bacterium (ex Bugula neritina AB1)]